MLASTASESPGKTRHESQFPLSSRTEQHQKGDLLKTLTHQATQNGMLIRLGLLKSGNLMNLWQLEQGDLLYSHSTRTDSLLDKMDSDKDAESEMSFKSRSFLHRVYDQVRKGQYQSSKDATKDFDKHSVIWECFYITSVCILGE